MPRPFPEDHEEPWTEEEWLEDMKRNDARADRFGELLETFMDHPDRDQIVAREMGWNELADDLTAAEEQGVDLEALPADDDDDGEDVDDPFAADEGEDWKQDLGDVDSLEELEDEREPDDVKLDSPPVFADMEEDRKEAEDEEKFMRDEPARHIAEYKMCNRIGMKIRRLLDPYTSGEGEDPTDGLLGVAWIGPHIASAKIIGGHSLGYDADYINGNIARQRIGLDGMDKSIEAFEQLKQDKFLPVELVDSIVPELNTLRTALVARIERLRARARRLHGKE
jgi:hypothetical protein